VSRAINWSAIKKAFEKGSNSNVSIGKIYGVTEAAIRKRAKKESWQKTNFKMSSSSSSTAKDRFLFIDDFASKQFDNLKSKLGEQITIVDEPLLIALCNQYSRYSRLEERVKLEGETIISTKGIPYLNPTFNALQSSIKTLVTLSKEFGMTIASRKKAGVKLKDNSKTKNSIFNLVDMFRMEDFNI